MRRTALAVLATLSVITAPACSRGGGTSGVKPAASTVPFVAVDPASTDPADKAIGTAQARLRQVPTDAAAQKQLAAAFLQKVRETADPSYYAKVDGILAGLGGAKSTDGEVLLLEGTLLLARHQFRAALADGKAAVIALPSAGSAYGIEVDADNELGQYDEALVATQHMADLRPDLVSLSRVSYARELRGDLPGAIQAMQQAVTAGQGGGQQVAGSEPGIQSGENVAYVQTLLGNLLLIAGRVADAQRAYEQAITEFPGFAAARAGEASVLVARGHPAAAADLLAEVVKTQPLTQYVISEGDDYAAAGMAERAAQAYALVDVITRLYRAGGVNVDVENALYEADHHPTAAAVDAARRALKDRGGVTGHDTLAWALYGVGRVKEAKAEIDQVLAVGDRDPQFRFHAAAIDAAAGDQAGATAELDLVLGGNPHFSALYQPKIAELAARLGRNVPPPAP
ncbi:MAG: hypothetical protein NVSMB12_05660 [Acidimicrobiales bacterium]